MKTVSENKAIPAQRSEITATSAAIVESIRARAYELYEQRGRADEHDVDDWLQAESDLQSKTMMA
jgi:hypothetical protein